MLAISVGTLFVASVLPGLLLAALYFVYLLIRTRLNPELAPSLPKNIGPSNAKGKLILVLKSFIPPIALIVLVLGSILGIHFKILSPFTTMGLCSNLGVFAIASAN